MVDEERLAKAIEATKGLCAATGREFDPETEDLYEWAMKQGELMNKAQDNATIAAADLQGLADGSTYWSVWFAARKTAMILLTFTREREGQEITPEMLEEMRTLCANVAYD